MIAITPQQRTRMQPTPTDDEIRANPAFPRLLAAHRLSSWVFWAGAPLFLAAVAYASTQRAAWAYAVAGLLSLGNVGGQVYGNKRARRVVLDISTSPAVRQRADQLASRAAKPLLVRWLPGA
jgi:hypothetical protein